MSITKQWELDGMKRVAEAVAVTLREMQLHARSGMSTKALDDFGGQILKGFGARSAPKLTYGFPGSTCISVNEQVAHGIPSERIILREGDLINIDVSAELDGYFADNGGSFILGDDIHHRQKLVDASRSILLKAINNIHGGVRISDIGGLIESEARRAGYNVLKNLTGHGIGRRLHEAPHEIANFRDRNNHGRFRKNSVVAIETFISTDSTLALTSADGFTLVGNKGGVTAQHEHTIVVTENAPLILTSANGIC